MKMEDFNFSGIHQSVVLPKVADKSTCALSSDERTQNDSLSQTDSPIPQEIALQGDSSAEATKVSLLPFSPTYDADGNATLVQTSTGTWSISYNGENRPVRFENASTQTVVECGYDSQGRRFEKKVTVAGTLTLHERYAYDGYLQIAAFDVAEDSSPEGESTGGESAGSTLSSQLSLKRVIFWDPEEPTATRPLAINVLGDNLYFPTVDLTKNVCELVDFYGDIAATYDYAPFGAVSAGTSSGSAAPANPFQWSSEFYDAELDLVYYNYRHYSPADGRWLSRDPIEEQGGLNLYTCLINNAMRGSDFLGRISLCDALDDPLSAAQKELQKFIEKLPAIAEKESRRGIDRFLINLAEKHGNSGVDYSNFTLFPSEYVFTPVENGFSFSVTGYATTSSGSISVFSNQYSLKGSVTYTLSPAGITTNKKVKISREDNTCGLLIDMGVQINKDWKLKINYDFGASYEDSFRETSKHSFSFGFECKL